MKNQNYTRPPSPLTPKVKKNIRAKVNALYRTYRDVSNREKTAAARKDLTVRLTMAALKAYEKYGQKCRRASYETFAAGFIKNEIKKYLADRARQIDEHKCTLSGDQLVREPHDSEAASLFDLTPAKRGTSLREDLMRFDIFECLRILALSRPLLARVLFLWMKNYSAAEIATFLKVSRTTVENKYIPRARAAFKKIYFYEKKSGDF